MPTQKNIAKKRRHARVRSKIKGTEKIPRLSIFRSLTRVYAQLIDDEKGQTLAASSDSKAKNVGLDIAKKALAKKIKQVVFDRSGYKYHGKIKAVAEAAREGGLKF